MGCEREDDEDVERVRVVGVAAWEEAERTGDGADGERGGGAPGVRGT